MLGSSRLHEPNKPIAENDSPPNAQIRDSKGKLSALSAKEFLPRPTLHLANRNHNQLGTTFVRLEFTVGTRDGREYVGSENVR